MWYKHICGHIPPISEIKNPSLRTEDFSWLCSSIRMAKSRSNILKKEMKEEKTLRDEIAMSMEFSSIPTATSKAIIETLSKEMGVERVENDPVSQMKFSFHYQAWCRYAYADAMLEQRKK